MASQERIVILTGAGVSAESGIPTFRAPDGLWEQHRVEDVATPEGFARDPELVHRFYNARRAKLLSGIAPNAAHFALAELQKARPGRVTLITQNIDDLHERAGSSDILHMHGELLQARCTACHGISPWRTDMDSRSVCPQCGKIGTLRVHVVWFGEIPLHMDAIYEAVRKADIFIAIGTSGRVYPAAGLGAEARAHGAHTIEVNPDVTETAHDFAEHLVGPAGREVPSLVERLLKSKPR